MKKLLFAIIWLLITSGICHGQIITTVAGVGSVFGVSLDGIPATTAKLSGARSIAVDPAGNLYIGDGGNRRIKKVDAAGIISTIAGTGCGKWCPGFSGDGGPATNAMLDCAISLEIDRKGNLYFYDGNNNRVRKIDNGGIITTVAGDGGHILAIPGSPATSGLLRTGLQIAIDTAGNLYSGVGEYWKVNTAGIVEFVAGGKWWGFSGDGGPATAAQFYDFAGGGIAADTKGNVYIADKLNYRIRRVDAAGIITTIAGTGTAGYSGDGGPATAAQITPWFVNADAKGNLYITETDSNRVRKIDAAGIITTIAGTGAAGFSGDGGAATAAKLNFPGNCIADTAGNIYIGDEGNFCVRKIYKNTPPVFTAGVSQSFTLCENAAAYNLNSLLAVKDTNAGQKEVWSAIAAAKHGTAITTLTLTATGGVVTPTGLSYTPTVGYSGNDTFKVRVTDGMDADTITVYVTINPTGTITGSRLVCLGQPNMLSNATTGGTWSSSKTTIATIGSSTGITSGVATGTAAITYTTAAGCKATAVVTVNTSPAAITGAGSVCAGSTTSLSTSPTGGTWSSSNSAVATVSAGSVSGLATGTTTITYTLAGGCTATHNMTVTPAPTTITGAGSVCAGAATMLSNTVTGGTWSSGNTAVATVSSGSVSGVAAGTAGITYSLGTGCTATTTVTVYTSPAAIAGAGSVCAGATTSLSTSPTGGTWSSSNTAVATMSVGSVGGLTTGTTTITYTLSGGCAATHNMAVVLAPTAIVGAGGVCAGAAIALSNASSGGTWSSSNTTKATIHATTGVVTGVAAGTATITYSLGTGCTVTAAVSVHANPAAIAGGGAVCESTTITLSNATPGGAWSDDGSGNIITGITGIVTAVTAGTATVSYTVASTGCSATKTIAVNTTPTPISAGAGAVCVGTAITLGSSSGGTWASSSTRATVGIGSGIVTGVSAGTSTITYALSTGCKATTTVTIYPAPATITGAGSVCVGATTAMSNVSMGGVWTATGAAVIDGMGTVGGMVAGTATISYTLLTGCIATKTITVQPVPTITGMVAICAGNATTWTPAGGGGATWSSGATGIATIGATSGIVTGLTAGTATLTYTIATGCKATGTITINPLPTIMGAGSVCAGAVINLSSGTTGGAWSSSNTTVATVNTTGLVTGKTAGTATISYTTGAGCTTTKPVIVHAAAAPITGVKNMCDGGDTITVRSADAPAGIWTSSLVTISPAGLVTAMSRGVAGITYTLPTGCMATAALTVNPMPGAIVKPGAVCEGAVTLLSNSITGGVWTSSNTAVATVGATTGAVTGVLTGTTIISYTLPTGCMVVDTIGIFASPGVITGAGTICENATITVSNTVSGGVWTSAAPGTALAGSTTGIITGVAAGTASIVYTLPGGCAAAATVTVLPLPVQYTITGGGTFCGLDTGVHVGLGGSAAGYTYELYNGSVPADTMAGTGGFLDFGLQTAGGIYSVAAINPLTGCRVTMKGIATVSVVIPPAAAVDITPSPGVVLCAGTMVMIMATPTNGGGIPAYEWKVNSVVSGTGVLFNYRPKDGDVVVVMMTGSEYCTSPRVAYASAIMKVITPVDPDITITTDPATGIEKGQSITLTATVTNSLPSLTYQWQVNDIAIGGATDAAYTTNTLAHNDEVACRVTSSGVCVTEATMKIRVGVKSTDVKPLTPKGELLLYPNPAQDELVIEGGDGSSVAIYDVLGQRVYSAEHIAAKHRVDMSRLSAGVYMVHVGNVAGRVVVVR